METYLVKRYIIEYYSLDALNKADAKERAAERGDPTHIQIVKETVKKINNKK